MRYSCPDCGSEDLVKFSVLHAAGTGTAHYGGPSVMVGSGGGVGFGVHAGSGHVTTELAAACAPPKRPEEVGDGCGCALGVGLAVGCFLAWLTARLPVSALPGWGWQIIGWGVVLASALIAYLYWCRAANGLQREREQCQAAWARWARTWRCMRCGHAWVFDE